MTAPMDTSAEAVERLAALYEGVGPRDDEHVAAVMRALAAERDEARVDGMRDMAAAIAMHLRNAERLTLCTRDDIDERGGDLALLNELGEEAHTIKVQREACQRVADRLIAAALAGGGA